VLIVEGSIALLNVAVTAAELLQTRVEPASGVTEITVGRAKGEVALPALSESLHPADIMAITAANRNAGIQNFLRFELRISFSSLHACKAIPVEPRYRNCMDL
jgi:hypothetical protein